MIWFLLKLFGFGFAALMANDLIPYKRPGEDISGHATAAITGKRAVQISAARTSGPGLSNTAEGGNYSVAHPANAGANGGAGKMIFGIAKYDAAINKKVGVVREGIVPVNAGAAITAGQKLEVDATGSVIPLAAGTMVGYACNDAAINTDCEVALLIS
jgi:uncharacterized membrane protein